MKTVTLRHNPACKAVFKGSAFGLLVIGLAALCLGQYSSRRQPNRIIQLSKPELKGQLSLEELLAKSPNIGQFTPRPLELSQIGQLAWAGQGLIQPKTDLPAAPPASATSPIRLYLARQDGVFVYEPAGHMLRQTWAADIRPALVAAAREQPALLQAPCHIVIAGTVRPLVSKYGRQAKKYMLFEAGRVAQKIQLQAASLNLSSVPIAVFNLREVERACRLPKELDPIYIICIGYTPEQDQQQGAQGQASRKSAVLVIPAGMFRDEELFETKMVLDQAGVATSIASSRLGPVAGVLGNIAQAEIGLTELNIDEYDAIVFIGGPGAMRYFEDPVALGIVRDAANKGKVLAAISIAPAVLANAGVLQGVKATSFVTVQERLERAGAVFTGAPLERHGSIITARDPGAARLFGQAITEALAAADK